MTPKFDGLLEGHCVCGRRVTRGNTVPRAARPHGGTAYCYYEGAVYDKSGQHIGFVWDRKFVRAGK